MKKDIYIIKNRINNKVYIGQAIDSKRRFQAHCKPSASTNDNDQVAKAIQKYGKENFWYELLEEQIEDYNEKEKYWIKEYNSIVPNGYNLNEGGEEPPIMKGYGHPESVLTEEDVKNLTNDLLNTTEKMSALAIKYGFSSKTSISEFNKGLTYVRDIEYPIRKESPIGKLTESDVDEIIDILSHTYRSFESIGKQYGVEARAISRINKGIFHKRNIEYPIREGQVGRWKPVFTYDQVTDIIYLLLNTNRSLRDIAKEFNGSYYDVLGIKNGTTTLFRRKNLKYPLRPNN